MKFLKQLPFTLLLIAFHAAAVPPAIHVWETQELTFTAKNSYKNAYNDVTLWIYLSGPGFKKRVYGFWDGGNTFHLRLVATTPGAWSWKSGSTPNDPGLSGKSGSYHSTRDRSVLIRFSSSMLLV